MNAPLPVKNIDSIGIYEEILPKSFIVETQERRQQIQANRQESLAAAAKVKTHCHNMSKELDVLENEFRQGSSSFDRMAKSCRINAELITDATARIRNSLEKMKLCKEKREMLASARSRS